MPRENTNSWFDRIEDFESRPLPTSEDYRILVEQAITEPSKTVVVQP